MPMTEDLAAFFSADEHATQARLDGRTVTGIFEHGYLDIDGISTYTAMYTLAASSAPDVVRGSVLVIGSETFRVRGPQPDGTGIVVLPLEAQ